ncbi:MAG: hypothetical protein DI626_11150 [Micavibrio aeruginosavorus]|uniref:DUF465 domain-containing protein n=1 Tax=Micavibrio aeruginosavorus TaxID=349221 RepID=A0A2W4ZF32_9BACT|nr:MAG: hypothetical protein DI626_11150 [Micavibrio aeruginosavorus]
MSVRLLKSLIEKIHRIEQKIETERRRLAVDANRLSYLKKVRLLVKDRFSILSKRQAEGNMALQTVPIRGRRK